MGMLALPRPYGSDASSYAHLILTVQGEVDWAEARYNMMQMGCAEVHVNKAISCLRHSGRYDCYLQRPWVAYSYPRGEVQAMFAECGLHFFIDEFRPPLK